MITRTAIAVLVAAASSGCVATGKLDTPSGRPEVHVEGVTPEAASAACLARLMTTDFQIEQSTTNVVQGVKEAGMGASILLGSTYDPTVWLRSTYLIAKDPTGVRIYMILGTVSNRGSGIERVRFCATQGHYDLMQDVLLGIRQQLIDARDAAIAVTAPVE